MFLKLLFNSVSIFLIEVLVKHPWCPINQCHVLVLTSISFNQFNTNITTTDNNYALGILSSTK